MIIQGAFLLVTVKNPYLENIFLPNYLSKGKSLISKINSNVNLWGFSPYFLGVGLFLYWRFDKEILTLLWVIELFVIFSFGLYRKEKRFLNIAQGLLGLSLLRLVFYDLKETSVLTRGVVFLCVGAIMLLMNGIQRKYKHRFSK